jgi:hypothetical protein
MSGIWFEGRLHIKIGSIKIQFSENGGLEFRKMKVTSLQILIL